MERRAAMRLLGAAAFAGVPGCSWMGALSPPEEKESSEGYRIPGTALMFLKRHARNGYACWEAGRLVSASGDRGTFPAFSVTKSVAALMTARAVTEGRFRPDDEVGFPEWRGRAPVTVRHLLNLTSGLAAGDRELYSARPSDKGRAALRLRQAHPPGTLFEYGPAGWEALGEFLRRRLPDHGTGLSAFLGQTLSALGIRSSDWRLDERGTPYLSTGLICGLNDLGRLGSALADLANGHDRAGVSSDVFRGLIEPRPANPMFSAGIWWNRGSLSRGARAVEPERVLTGTRPPGFWKNACLLPGSDPGWFALVGSGGTRVYALPRASVVIAVERAGGRWSDAAMMRSLVAGWRVSRITS